MQQNEQASERKNIRKIWQDKEQRTRLAYKSGERVVKIVAGVFSMYSKSMKTIPKKYEDFIAFVFHTRRRHRAENTFLYKRFSLSRFPGVHSPLINFLVNFVLFLLFFFSLYIVPIKAHYIHLQNLERFTFPLFTIHTLIWSYLIYGV